MITHFWKGGLIAASALMLASCGSESDIEVEETAGVEDSSGSPMSDAIGSQEGLGTVAGALESTGLEGVLEGEASYTLLAPTDAAFEAFGELGDDGALIANLLRSHMIPGAITPEAIKEAGGETAMTSFGSGELTFTVDGDTITVTNGDGQSAKLTGKAVVTSNGVILPIDTVLADASALQAPAAGQ